MLRNSRIPLQLCDSGQTEAVIDRNCEAFLRACALRGVDFRRTLMLGRQQLEDTSFAESFFRELGADSVESIDASEFEGATIIADLNRPLPESLRRRFSVVFDGGTLEHVFDIATALRSCLDMVELGGHYLGTSPANNWPGHGFYQISPELVFRTLSQDSGFEIRGVFIAELRRRQRWYLIRDPKDHGRRVYWRNPYRTQIVTVARRNELIDLSNFIPQQSDYVARWQTEGHVTDAVGMRAAIKRWAPRPAVDLLRTLQRRRNEQLRPPLFTPVSLERLGEHIR